LEEEEEEDDLIQRPVLVVQVVERVPIIALVARVVLLLARQVIAVAITTLLVFPVVVEEGQEPRVETTADYPQVLLVQATPALMAASGCNPALQDQPHITPVVVVAEAPLPQR
jgi:hypothetical protein